MLASHMKQANLDLLGVHLMWKVWNIQCAPFGRHLLYFEHSWLLIIVFCNLIGFIVGFINFCFFCLIGGCQFLSLDYLRLWFLWSVARILRLLWSFFVHWILCYHIVNAFLRNTLDFIWFLVSWLVFLFLIHDYILEKWNYYN